MNIGYEVFRNMSCVGPADLVAWKIGTDEKYLIDVKTVNKRYIRKDGIETVPIVAGMDGEGIHCLFVSKGEVIGFYKRGAAGTGSDPYWPFKTPW